MDTAVITLFSLMATSLLLSVALAVAWRTFGRERHAALWAFAFGLSAATWALNLVATWWPRAHMALAMLAVLSSIDCFALVALGFRRRVGLPERGGMLVAATVLALLIVAWSLLGPSHLGIVRAVVVFFGAAMVIVSARSLRAERRGSQRASGGAAFWMLTLFAVYLLGLGLLALRTSNVRDVGYQAYQLLFLMGLPTGLFGVGLFAMFLLAADLAEAMRQLAASDPLTAILNRRGFEQAAEPLVAQSQRHGRSLAVVIADLDRFKAINDRFGHGVGDAVLQCFAAHVGGAIRQCDLFGRIGGEEFVLLLPDTDAAEAFDAMERVRHGLGAALEALVPSAGISASFGIALLHGRFDTLVDAMQRADQALYQSKIAGRDRVTMADSTLVTTLPQKQAA